MKDIILKITGKTISTLPKPAPGQSIDEPVEFITVGQMQSRGNVTQITYEESELSGIEGCKTSLIITPGRLRMARSGGSIPGGTVMEFEKGKRCTGMYETPLGSIGMEILTDKVSDFKCDEENISKMSVEYAISLKGLL